MNYWLIEYTNQKGNTMSDSELLKKMIATVESIEDIEFLRSLFIKLAQMSELQAQENEASKAVTDSLKKMIALMSVMMKDLIHLCTSNHIAVPSDIAMSMKALQEY